MMSPEVTIGEMPSSMSVPVGKNDKNFSWKLANIITSVHLENMVTYKELETTRALTVK